MQFKIISWNFVSCVLFYNNFDIWYSACPIQLFIFIRVEILNIWDIQKCSLIVVWL